MDVVIGRRFTCFEGHRARELGGQTVKLGIDGGAGWLVHVLPPGRKRMLDGALQALTDAQRRSERTARLFAQVRSTAGLDANSLVLNGYVLWDSLGKSAARAVRRAR